MPLFALTVIGLGTIGWGLIFRKLYIDVIKDRDPDWDYSIVNLIAKFGIISALLILIGVQLLRR
jgi:hypothetical protein